MTTRSPRRRRPPARLKRRAQRSSKPLRRYARHRTAEPGKQLLFVDNDADWAVMNGPDKTDLTCPDCDLRLTPKTRVNRYLSHLPGESCDHGLPRAGGGGPMSPEHAWFQRRLAKICSLQGHEAKIEHGPTNADVYVADVGFVIEVQRWSTEFARRTNARQARGDRVIWFVPTTSDGPDIRRALNELPSARVRAEDPANRSRIVEPWSDDRHHIARIFVYDALLVLNPSTGQLQRQWRVDAWRFLGLLLRTEIGWIPPGTEVLPDRRIGGWVSPGDLAAAQAPPVAAPSQESLPHVVAETTLTDEPPIERAEAEPALPPPSDPPPLAAPQGRQGWLIGLISRVQARLRRTGPR